MDPLDRNDRAARDAVRAGDLFPELRRVIEAAYHPHGLPGVVIEVAAMLNDARETLGSRGIRNGTIERIEALIGDR